MRKIHYYLRSITFLEIKEKVLKANKNEDRAGDVAQAVALSPGMRAARVRSSAPHTNTDVVSTEN